MLYDTQLNAADTIQGKYGLPAKKYESIDEGWDSYNANWHKNSPKIDYRTNACSPYNGEQ